MSIIKQYSSTIQSNNKWIVNYFLFFYKNYKITKIKLN